MYKVGTWNSTERNLNFTRQYVVSAADIDDSSLRNKSFIVLTALVSRHINYKSEQSQLITICSLFVGQSPPYGMLKESANQLSGNDRFEGFGIDLIHELSLLLGFNYTFHLQEDGVYGSLGENGQWNGMIKELLEHVSSRAS